MLLLPPLCLLYGSVAEERGRGTNTIDRGRGRDQGGQNTLRLVSLCFLCCKMGSKMGSKMGI
jgi:hypothetical protein